MVECVGYFFFFKQKTAYELRISDWSSDVCSSDLVAVHVDVAISVDIQNMIRTAEERFGRLDVLVNNAGFGGKMTALHEQSEDSYDEIQAVNLKGVFLGMKYGITSMLKTGGGAIVNTASSAAIVGMKQDRKSTRLNSSH